LTYVFRKSYRQLARRSSITENHIRNSRASHGSGMPCI
jgi:hypothetical protein